MYSHPNGTTLITIPFHIIIGTFTYNTTHRLISSKDHSETHQHNHLTNSAVFAHRSVCTSEIDPTADLIWIYGKSIIYGAIVGSPQNAPIDR